MSEHPKIGIISGLSGIAAKWNRYQNMGIRLAQEELAAEGYRIELVFEDSATKAPKVIAAYNKLFDLDRVDAVLANDFGYAIAPLLPLVKRQKRFLVALSMPHRRYCDQAAGYYYSVTSQFSESKGAFDQFFVHHPEVKRIGLVIHDDPEWGNTYRGIWRSLADARGVTVVDEFLSADPIPDYKTGLTKILQGNPQAIFLAHEPHAFLKAARQLGYTGYVVSANNIFEMVVDTAANDAMLEGVYVVDPKISTTFRNTFVERFGQEPILEAYAGYEGLRSLAKAFQNDPEHPQRGIRSVAYSGVAGPIDFSGDTCAGNLSEWGLYRFEGGQARAVPEQ